LRGVWGNPSGFESRVAHLNSTGLYIGKVADEDSRVAEDPKPVGRGKRLPA